MRFVPVRIAVIFSTVVLLVSCGAATSRVSTTAGSTTKVVRFNGAVFDVPIDWPVYDLSADPHRCARFDEHAVYLGQQGQEASCPARLLGRTEAVQIEALNAGSQQHLFPTATTDVANGLQMFVQPQPETTRSVTAALPQLGLVMTVTFRQDPTQAEQILHSVRRG